LEGAADPEVITDYDFKIEQGVIDWRPMLLAILDDMASGVAVGTVSAKFHATLAAMIVAAAKIIGENRVLLTGGCFQNALLLNTATDALEQSGFSVYWHRQVPPNDGGLAFGQVMAVAHAL
jgi:hydrogenase maturation protein HypF